MGKLNKFYITVYTHMSIFTRSLCFGLLLLLLPNFISSFSLRTQEVCYPPFGCFNNAKPWRAPYRPNGTLPQSPEEIGTKFYMFENSSTSSAVEVFINDTD